MNPKFFSLCVLGLFSLCSPAFSDPAPATRTAPPTSPPAEPSSIEVNPKLNALLNPKENKKVVNGIDTEVLNNLIKDLKKDNKRGKATFFSDTAWQDGMRSVTVFTGYKIDGVLKNEKERHFQLTGDELTELGGTDKAPGAVEELMYAVGTCIAAAANAKASLMGVKLTKLEVVLESDIDLKGLLEVNQYVRPGIIEFRTKIVINGEADEATLRKIAMWGYNFSPASDTVRHGVSRAIPPKIEAKKIVPEKKAAPAPAIPK